MARITISESQVRRLAREVGQELIDQRDRKVSEYRHRQLATRTEVIPEAVVVEIAGGRIRTRLADGGPGVHDAQNKEDKIACLATLRGSTFTADPCPEPPQGFTCPRRVQRLVAQMKGDAGEALAQEIAEQSRDPASRSARVCQEERGSPKRLVGTCVASMETSVSFGPMMAAEACERGFYDARRRAFVADGSAYNWSIHRGYFADFEPITDFLHAVCYVYASAHAVSVDESSGWSQYLAWMGACWQGRVVDVLVELDRWQERLGEPPAEDGSAEAGRDPRRVVHRTRTYLRNNQERMAYPRYRQAGLPTTSSLVESLVGEVNARVKSKQKYWTRGEGSESILQLRAAVLSEDDRLRGYTGNRNSVR
ncbi:MAG: LysR family transcriptional regulator [Planctomycetes bacterium]|nr:LysR family transcriptional regulator [Planctomycetota bacterium]